MRLNPELLEEMRVPADAEIETWESVTEKTRKLGHKILKSCLPQTPLERYERMAVIPRGGYAAANILSRSFGYPSSELLHLSLTSYKKGKTQRTAFKIGQIPRVRDVKGKSILVIDEVCDSGLTLAKVSEVLEGLGASEVTTGVLHYKPEKSENGFVPDFHVAETAQWVVYPWEPYEFLGARALEEEIHGIIWLPDLTADPSERT